MNNNPNEDKGAEQPAQEEIKPPAVPAKREVKVVQDSGPYAYIYDTGRFEHAYRIAESMAMASLLPDHLLRDKRGEFTPVQIRGNCFRIVMQAFRWEVDPFALVDETFVTNGKIGYQGKVVAAVVNARAGLKERLDYSYSGTEGKDDYTITVSGTFLGEETVRTVSLSVGKAKTQNTMWAKDPEQKLVYSGVIRWARRHCPEIILGVTTEDDDERREYWAAQQAKPSKGAKPAFTMPPEEKVADAQEVSGA